MVKTISHLDHYGDKSNNEGSGERMSGFRLHPCRQSDR